MSYEWSFNCMSLWGYAVAEDKNQVYFEKLYRRGFRNNHLSSLENLLVSITNLAPFEQVTF